MLKLKKEALAVTWACERLSNYLSGMLFHIETDQKSLVPCSVTRMWTSYPCGYKDFRMRLMRFDYTISHIAGKLLTTAGTLSQAPLRAITNDDETHTNFYVNMVMNHLMLQTID